MKLYAFTTPDIPKNAGYLKIGETNGNVEKRVEQEGHELNVEHKIVWQDAVITDRSHIDKRIHRYLAEQGFPIQHFTKSGKNTELVKCTVGDLEKAFEIVKQQIYDEEKQREEVGNQFYLEIRNWFYWVAKTGDASYSVAEAEYTLRLIVRLMFVFFLKEKGIVPKEIFEENWIKENLKENEEYRYYNAVLRNLFFYSLNTPQNQRGELENKKLAKNLTRIKDVFKQIPFLNGGLFNEHPGDDFAISNDHFFSELQTRRIKELDGDYKVEGIVRMLSRYQFKTELDLIDTAEYTKTIDPEFIGKVFESLLACIDADSKESRRKITGSFYTPREIVSYMVNESLDEYLKTHNELLQCKILDPACGSGAFPCGVMNEIMQRIDPNKELSQTERYRKKLDILRNVIYGVDIQPMAVQIAILRLFLSLIQEIVPDKKKDNFGIEPLPNLETKFVCANTLIGLKYEKQGRLESPVVKATVKQLQETRSQYFMATAVSEKERLKKYDETLRETLSIAMEADGEFGHATALRLAQWNPYDQTKSAEFFDPMWMFGIENFDVVIGNPPYDVIENRNPMKADYEKHYSYLKRGRLNIYQCFFGKGTELLSTQGILAFIHPKTLLADAYLAATREYLLKEYPSFTIVNIVNRRNTFSSVLQSVIVSQWNKGAQTSGCRIGNVAAKNDLKKMQYLVKAKKDIVTKHGTLLISNNSKIYKLEKKIHHVKSITLHFVTGCTEWNKIKDYLSDKPKKGDKRFIYGENIQRYCFAPSKKRLGSSFINGDVEVQTLQKLAILTQRTTAVEQPYRIIATLIDPKDFDMPLAAENHTNVFVCKDRHTALLILGILNSRLMDFYFRLHNSNTQVSSRELNRLPIIDVPAVKQRSLAALVERRLNGEDVDGKIDALVYELYGLDAEEIEIIESNSPQR